MKKLILAVAIFLSGCTIPPEVRPAPVTTTPVLESQEFACEQLRSGATVRELVEHEIGRGVDEESAINYAITSVNQTCPEFFILVEDFFAEKEPI